MQGILWQCLCLEPLVAKAATLKQQHSLGHVTADCLNVKFQGRRQVLLYGFGILLARNVKNYHMAVAAEASGLELVPYVDASNGFKFLRPAEWNKIDKDGATVLFEDPSKKSNNVGMVVNPVRISSLKSFGTAQDVAERLIIAEKNKPSTNGVELLKVESRLLRESTPIYEIEYMLDSSRGIKRVFSAVTISTKKLYILNLVFDSSSPISSSMLTSLETIAGSLDLV